MTKPYPKMSYPENVPQALILVFERNEYKFHRTANELGVNVAHVHRLIVRGIEPKNFEIRQKLYLEKPAWLEQAVRNLIQLLEEKESHHDRPA